MTAITTGPVAAAPATVRTDSQLLRFALRADANLCAGLGLFVAMAADPLARLSGLTPTAEFPPASTSRLTRCCVWRCAPTL